MVPIVGWLAGIYCSRYAGGGTIGTFGYIVLVAAGLLVAPFVGISAMRTIPDFFEWESSGPRDFFVPALVAASVVCFVVALLASLVLA